MFYFIPSWYDSQRKWYTETPLWFRVFERMTFDDTVNQLKMFDAAGENPTLLLLSYQPQLRYFLHKQGVLSTAHWSFFDDIQNIVTQETRGINFKDLAWPAGTHFIYTPFLAYAVVGEKTIAEIHFAENGNLLYVEFQQEGRSDKRYVFDDRGFLSSILYYQEGQVHHQDYLNPQGVWQVREFLDGRDWQLEVNPSADHAFEQSFYDSWEDLIKERLYQFQEQQMAADARIVIAADSQHNQLLAQVFATKRKVYSFFGDRFDLAKREELADLVRDAYLFVVDSEQLEKKLQEHLTTYGLLGSVPVSRVTPFDTRLRLGRSQEVKDLIIYFLVDGLSQQDYQLTLERILGLMEENPLIHLQLVSYEGHRSKEAWEKDLLQLIESKYDRERFTSFKSDESENHLDGEEEIELTAVSVHIFSNENQIITALDTARLVLDLREVPDLYTQIASISAGIPQINRLHSEYVNHRENGWVLAEEPDLIEAITYYFDGLSNWNRSLVYAVQKMADYTSGRIISQWKELLER